jgi:hypothetical protein
MTKTIAGARRPINLLVEAAFEHARVKMPGWNPETRAAWLSRMNVRGKKCAHEVKRFF